MLIDRLLGRLKKERISLVERLTGAFKYSRRFYSQDGEDALLASFLPEDLSDGFYVDVGAHHPFAFSNTFYFYLRGWRGINIDALPGSMKNFNRWRKRDINLEIPISNESEEMQYYMFSQPALNGFNFTDKLIESRSKISKLLNIVGMKTRKLSDVLDEYLPQGQKITFMSIDVEELELSVLKSSNWEKYQPEFILVETVGINNTDEVSNFLNEKNYQLVGRVFRTSLFRLTRSN